MWKELWNEHRGAVCGVAGGLFLGIIYLLFGFWNMIMFGIIVYIGLAIGRRIDRNQPAVNFRPLLEWLTDRWRGFK